MSGPVRRSLVYQAWISKQCTRSFSSSGQRLADGNQNQIESLMAAVKKPDSPSRRGLPAQRSSQQSPKSTFNTISKLSDEASAATLKSRSELLQTHDRQDLERQMTRRWKAGDVYAPHDLSGVEMSKWKQVQQKGRPKKDVFDILRVNPLEHYKNFAMMSEYITDMGRIKNSAETGLRPVNQRKMAKAIRRAVGLGLLPSVHRHPEIIRKEMSNRQ